MTGKYRLVGLDISRLDNMWLENDIQYLVRGLGESDTGIETVGYETLKAMSDEGVLAVPVRVWPGRLRTVKPPSHMRKDRGLFRFYNSGGFSRGVGLRARIIRMGPCEDPTSCCVVGIHGLGVRKVLPCKPEELAWIAAWFKPDNFECKMDNQSGRVDIAFKNE